MTAAQDFLWVRSASSDGGIDELMEVARLDWKDMGQVKAVFRAWPGNIFWVIAAIASCLLTSLAFLAPDASDRLRVSLIMIGNCIFWVGLLVATGLVERHRVCEHGLIVGFKTKSRYIIPWSTIDPGRVRIVRRSNLIGRNPNVPSVSPHYRVGMTSGTTLALNGLDSAIDGWIHIPGILDVTDTKPGSRTRRTPYVWWQLGTRQPQKLAQAIEDAMIADGYPAHGLTTRAINQATTLRFKPGNDQPFPPRDTTDPIIGVTGPQLR